jgi:hypothetical protein
MTCDQMAENSGKIREEKTDDTGQIAAAGTPPRLTASGTGAGAI